MTTAPLDYPATHIERPRPTDGSDPVLTERTYTRKSTHWFGEMKRTHCGVTSLACGAPMPCAAGSTVVLIWDKLGLLRYMLLIY